MISDSLCLTDGCYVLNVYDSFGDGWSTGQLGSVTLAQQLLEQRFFTLLVLYLQVQQLHLTFTVGTTLGCTDTNTLTMMTVQILMMDLVSIHVQTTL